MLNKFFWKLGVIGLFIGCASVPSGAPKQFYEAQSSIQTMNKSDADDYFPTSVDRANKTFKEALSLLDDSTDEKAIDRVEEAKRQADGTVRLYTTVKHWDQNQSTFQDALASLDRIEKEPMNGIVMMTGNIESPFAKLKGSEFVSTLAYFNTNKSENPEYSQDEVNALVAILEKDPNFQVILTGHADMRGEKTYNQKLGLRRAVTIAKALEKRGINESQVIIESKGEDMAKNTTDHKVLMQFDRRVRAKIILR